jgi:hypothetical protein
MLIMNLRPSNGAVLNCIIEEFDERFYENVEGSREDILNIIAELLGRPDANEAELLASAADSERQRGKK